MTNQVEKEIESIFFNIYKKRAKSDVGRRRVRELKARYEIDSRDIYRIRKRVWARVHSDFLSDYYRKKRKEDKVKYDFRPENQPRRVAWQKKELEKFLKFQEDGLTAKELARKLRCSLASIGYHRRRYHLSRRILGQKWTAPKALTLLQKSEDVLERMPAAGAK